jgi:predicted Zn-dependent peptidase
MSQQQIEQHTLSNGFQLLIENMSDVQSAAFSLMVPAGTIYEPAAASGTSAALCDMVMRGAGPYDNRGLTTAIDRLGIQRHEHVGWNFLSFGGAMLSNILPDALKIYADVARRPRFPEEEFEPVMAGLTQGLLAQEDEPQRKLSTELRKRTYRSPWGRSSDGELPELPNISLKSLQHLYGRCFRPNGAILGVAGRVDPRAVLQQVEELFGDWKRLTDVEPEIGDRGPLVDHIVHSSTQVQIGIAEEAPPFGHPDYYAAWAASSILGGGPSARLFTEVRERRGLCYSVSTNLNSLKTEGRMMTYAGTTVERAQETLDVTLGEIRKLREGIDPAELSRCQARAKSALIMQQESTSARASSLARDWFHLGRVSTLDEVRREVETLTVKAVTDVVDRYSAAEPTILTLGPQPLVVR